MGGDSCFRIKKKKCKDDLCFISPIFNKVTQPVLDLNERIILIIAFAHPCSWHSPSFSKHLGKHNRISCQYFGNNSSRTWCTMFWTQIKTISILIPAKPNKAKGVMYSS